MADIGTYICSNQKCSFTVRLSSGFPLWSKDTPSALRLQPISSETAAYVVRYRSEVFCRTCQKIVEHQDQSCTSCNNAIHTEEAGTTCPRCQQGVFSLTNLSVF